MAGASLSEPDTLPETAEVIGAVVGSNNMRKAVDDVSDRMKRCAAVICRVQCSFSVPPSPFSEK